jgi:hypothetical protein
MAKINSVIASEVFWGQRPGQDAFQIDVLIGTPYQVWDDQEYAWVCPVEVRPLHPELQEALGSSSLQALCLASSLAFSLLQAFKEREGDLFHSPGEEISLESYAFGIAARQDDH